jgi:hypothetical protein
MSNAKGSDDKNKLNQPTKVTATTRSEAKAAAIVNVRQHVQKAMATPTSSVRAAMAQIKTGAQAAKVAYDVLSRFLSLIETGVAIDAATLLATKAAIDTLNLSDHITQKQMGKVLDQITHLNDVLVRVVSYHRTYTDVAHSADLAAKKLTKSPYSEAQAASDVRRLAIGKNKSDSIRMSENFSRVVSFNRPIADATHSVDNFVRVVSYHRTYADQTHLAEVVGKNTAKPKNDTFGLSDLKKVNFGKAANEILKANDARSLLFTKKINDFVSAMESFVIPYITQGETAVNLATLSDHLTRVISFVRLFQDTARTTDTLKRSTAKPRSEVARATDRLTHVATFRRTFADPSHASDTFSRTISFNRSYADQATAAEVKKFFVTKGVFSQATAAGDSRTLKPTKGFAETQAASDSFSRLVTYRRFPNSTATSAVSIDVIATVKSFKRTFQQNAQIGDNLSKTVSFNRSFADINAASDAFSRLVTFRRSIGELLQAQENFLRTVSYNRSKSDTSYAVDVFVKVLYAPRNFNDNTHSVDRITSKIILKKLESVIRMSDSLVFSTITHPPSYPPRDTQRVADSFKKLVSFVRSYQDQAHVADAAPKTVTKQAGTEFNVWSDFNELQVSYELTQFFPSYRVEIVRSIDRPAKTIGKNIANITYWTKSYWDDYNELTFGTPVDQDLVQTLSASYTADTELQVATDAFTKVVTFRRLPNDTSVASDATGRSLRRTVGDNKVRTYTDFADVYYTQEYTSGAGGYGAKVQLNNAYPNYTITVLNAGYNYTVGQLFTIQSTIGTVCTFTVATIDGNGGILTVNNITGTPNRVIVRAPFWSDFADLSLGSTYDQDLRFYSPVLYAYPGPQVVDIGPPAPQKVNVIGQDLLFAFPVRSDGDIARAAEKATKTIFKDARVPITQGYWSDFNDLFIGTPLDQDLAQQLNKSKSHSVSAIGAVSVVTLGPIKGVRDTVNLAEYKASKLSKPKAEITTASDTFPKTYSITAGSTRTTTWTDFNEISLFAQSALMEMQMQTAGKYENILAKETVGKTTTKPMVFDTYVWRDFNELTFGTSSDQELLMSWANRSNSDIVRTMDDARRTISPAKNDVIKLPETLGKSFIKDSIGDSTFPASLVDFLGLLPVAYRSGNIKVQDQELLLTFVPGRKYDGTKVSDSAPKFITKSPVRRVSAFWSDFNDLTFGTQYDQDLVQYQSTYRPETFIAADFMRRVVSSIRTFADTVHITDSILLMKNGGPFFTLMVGKNDNTNTGDAKSKYIGMAAGNVNSTQSVWYDFADVFTTLELAQYYDRSGGTTDINHVADKKVQTLSKTVKRTRNIWNEYDSDLFFNEDLLQYLNKDYLTELIVPYEQFVRSIKKPFNDTVANGDNRTKIIEKGSVGDTRVRVWADYLDLNNQELTQAFPSVKIDVVYLAETKPKYTGKQAGNYYSRTFDATLDDFVFDIEISRPYRFDQAKANDAFTKLVTFRRLPNEPLKADDLAAKGLSKGPKADTSRATDTRTKFYNKVAGSGVFNIWSDFNELSPSAELTQYYPDFRVEYIRLVEIYRATLTKPKNELVTSADLPLLKFGKNPSERLTTPETLAKGVKIGALGNYTYMKWFDSYEILSYDPTLLTFGSYNQVRTDNVTYTDNRRLTYNKVAGKFRGNIWSDFGELELKQDLMQQYPDYVTEWMLSADSKKISINKAVSETPKAFDSGAARLFKADGYSIPSDVYFADDYCDDIISSTF